MDDPLQLAVLVAWASFALAFLFGVIANRTHFCTMGAVSDVINIGDWSRMRMWLLAIAVAMVCTNGLVLAGILDLSKSFYTGERFLWLSHIAGGALFGVGMTIASGCGSRNLIRLGGGNLKSLIVLVCIGISAYMTLKGLFALARVNLLDSVALHLQGGQDLPNVLVRHIGTGTSVARIACTAVIATCIAIFVFADAGFRRNREYVTAGLLIGVIVAGGWYVTGRIGYLAEDPNTLSEAFVGTNSKRPESFTFVGPVGYSLELLMLWTDTSLKVTFGIAAVLGLFAGALVYSLASRSFRWEGFTTAADLRNHIMGGVLMGFGGVTALGCSVGQGITGLSTLALGSFLTFISIVLGSALTMKWLYWRTQRGGI
ncbi:MAG: YeeE/YedE family protein [Betaproteobacteria bacterium]|nr:YeeE/YedE family protein [Betaproteobacteria bacterium]